jgi:hypothetical protein
MPMDWKDVQIMKNIAYHDTMLLQAEIEMQAMITANKEREAQGLSLPIVKRILWI